MKTALAGVSDVYRYAHDAILSIPSEHLKPRMVQGDGITLSIPAEMQPGVTLISGLFGQVLGFRLYAADGEMLKEWPIDFFKIAPDEMNHKYHALIHGEHLYPNGDIIANLDGRGIVRFDACGKIKWRNSHQSNHSIFVDDAGDIWTPILKPARADHGMSTTMMTFDNIARFDAETGAMLEEIDLVRSIYDGPGPGIIQFNPANFTDMLHINDVEILSASMAAAFPMFKAGDILVSARNLHQIWVLDGQDHRIKWWSAGPSRGQHDPDFEPDGTIVLFDNRPGSVLIAPMGWHPEFDGSRILSINPADGKTRVLYASDAENTFYSAFRGKQQRLANGNTLITETDGGRAFEVTARGKMVWEFVNGWSVDKVAWVMGATRYPDSYGKMAKAACN